MLSSTFAQPAPGQPKRYEYSRSGNPTREALERCLAALEGAKSGFAFASGSAATLTLLSLLKSGDHVLCGDDVYGGTFRLLDKVVAPMGIQASFVDLRELERAASAAAPEHESHLDRDAHQSSARRSTTSGVWPSSRRARGVLFVVDNTFASPVLQRPLELGANVVMHSTTKYINGHSDAVGGALITSDAALAERLRFLQNAIGAVPSPIDCFLVLRGIKTLPLQDAAPRGNGRGLLAGQARTGERGARRSSTPACRAIPTTILPSRQMADARGHVELGDRGRHNAAARNFLSPSSFSRWPKVWAAWSRWPNIRRA